MLDAAAFNNGMLPPDGAVYILFAVIELEHGSISSSGGVGGLARVELG